MEFDINPFDGDGIDARSVMASAAALALAGLAGRKGYTNLKVIGPETLQTYFRGTKANDSFLQTPRGKDLMRYLESPNSISKEGLSNFIDFRNVDRRAADAAAKRQTESAGLLLEPSSSKLLKIKPDAKANKSTFNRFDLPDDATSADAELTKSILKTNKVIDPYTNKVLKRLSKDRVIAVKPKNKDIKKYVEDYRNTYGFFPNDPDLYDFALAERIPGVGIRGLKKPGRSLYKNIEEFESDPIYNPAASLRLISKAADAGQLTSKEIADFLSNNKAMFAQEGIDLTQPGVGSALRELAVKELGFNTQLVDRYKGLGLYRNILEKERGLRDNSIAGNIGARISAQRQFRAAEKAAVAPRQKLRNSVLSDNPNAPWNKEVIMETGETFDTAVPKGFKVGSPEHQYDRWSKTLRLSTKETKKRITKAFAIQTAHTTDDKAKGRLDNIMKDLWPVLERNRQNEIKATVSNGTFTPEPIPYVVKSDYDRPVDSLGRTYVKKYPPTRPADFEPSEKDSVEYNKGMRTIVEGKSYPTQETIYEDEVRALRGEDPLEIENIDNKGRISKTKSAQRALSGKNEVVMDEQDIAVALGALPSRTYSNDYITNALMGNTDAYAILREALLRSIMKGANPSPGKDLFIEQARRTLRGQVPGLVQGFGSPPSA